jgi:hypothetical protein
MSVLWRIAACVIASTALSLAVFASEKVSSASPFTITATSGSGWDIEYRPADRLTTTIVIEGKRYFRFLEPGVEESSASAGTPQLPADGLSLGIPFGSTITVELTNSEYETLEQQSVAPHPAYRFTAELEAVEEFQPDAGAYAQNRFFPAEQITTEPPFTLREQRIAVVRIRPYQFNPATLTLRRLMRATLRVRLSTSASLFPPHSHDPHFEATYKSLLLNYEQAKQWRVSVQTLQRPSLPLNSLPPDPTRDWFETGRNYFKAAISADGWHKITRGDLLAAGADFSSLDLNTIKVVQRGLQLPIVVRPDTTVEFYAVHNYGDSSYSDFYTDTSAAWLTWGGSTGSRFAAAAVGGAPLSTITSAVHTLHVEQNLSYFFASNSNEQIDNNTVAGETWYWRWIGVNQQFDFPFTLDSLDTSAPTATVRVRVWGTGYLQPPSQTAHTARIFVNDSLVGDYNFLQRQGGTFVATIPRAWLRVGSNTLRVRNIDTGLSANTFYLDWFEIDYPRILRAISNQLHFVSPTASGGVARFIVSGFSNSQIEVYDLTLARMMTGGSISGDALSGYTIAFQDTFSSKRTYIAFCSGSQRTVPPLRQKQFADIRVNATGADYIIISHKDFLTQANQLALHRQNVNGVRVKVIDVDDIYDEFNYGVMHATPIKTFLSYARSWTPPAPAYVLFFGDAIWDFHHYLSTSVKTNYVPSYGFPTGDNWFGCFDSTITFIPSMYIGRIPAENTTQAQNAVTKIIAFDNFSPAEWNKNFLFITGGNNITEQTSWNYLSESSIYFRVTPPPIGGTPLRVYKTLDGIVDGEHTTTIRNLFQAGVSFVNFIGHSGGRLWGVDPGPIADLPNTNGKLPFISSVSCNVGNFADPAATVLSEEFLLVPNRGAIAAWASSSLGYPSYGAAMMNEFLTNLSLDNVREFGKLTSNARYRLWTSTGSGYITVAMVNLNPLIGDPLSKFPLALQPDLALASSDIVINKQLPTPNDTSLTIKVKLHNYGLVPGDSVALTITDVYDGAPTYLLNNKKLPPTRHVDSLTIPWNAARQLGLHTIIGSLDPLNTITEFTEFNNVASSDQYIYTNLLYTVKPLNNMVVPPGQQRLVVSSPRGYDSTGFNYFFELDTLDTFNSPGLVTSGAVTPASAWGEWLTPSLPSGKVYFWRARTQHGSLVGNWVTSSFSTSTELPSNPMRVRLRENTKKQFQREQIVKLAATDSGLTIAPTVPFSIYCRSVGNLYNQYRDYYALIQINEQRVAGYWCAVGRSFIAARGNDLTGALEFRRFPLVGDCGLAGSASQADSLAAFINSAAIGSYIAVAVIFDGQTNVNENLRQAMDSLGATEFRNILSGQTYAFIGRKGNGAPGMPPLELRRTGDSCVVSLTTQSIYGNGSGSMTTPEVPVPASWDSLHWQRSGDLTKTNPRIALIGVRSTGGVDTLRIIPKDSLAVSLSSLNAVTAGPRYASIKLAALLSTADATMTPVVGDWRMDFAAAPDLAVSARTLGMVSGETSSSVFSLPVTVYNIGYQRSDSVKIVVNAFDKYNRGREVASAKLDSIVVDGNRTITIPIPTNGFAFKTILQVTVGSVRKARDLIVENNTAYYTLYRVAEPIHSSPVRVYADGIRIMDGDYISAKPSLLVQTENEELPATATEFKLFVDKKRIGEAIGGQSASRFVSASSNSSGTEGNLLEQMFTPTLADGRHELRFTIERMNAFGQVDSLEQTIAVNVLRESRVLQPYNYPNPFSKETYFTFTLTGEHAPEELRIRIFTVAGRKVRELVIGQAALQVGFNRIPWDGRDDDGDEIANGYYFYQISLTSRNKTVSTIEKLVKVR